MSIKIKHRSSSKLAALVIAATIAIAPLAAPATTYASINSGNLTQSEQYQTFLSTKYQINVNSQLTKGQYIQYVADLLPGDANSSTLAFTDVASTDAQYAAIVELNEKGILSGATVSAKQQLEPWVAAIIAVRASGLKELALTYTTAKTDAALKKINSSSAQWAPHVAQELAVAIDNELIPEQYYKEFSKKSVASSELINTLLGQIVTFNGQYKQYLGSSQDADIIAELIAAYSTSDIIQVNDLQTIVNTALEKDIITGYNFKDSRFDANFVDEYALTYGHSDLKHAIQLIGLLRSEGIEAKVQFEPKTSAFQYLIEWGEPTQSDTYQVKQIANGKYVAYSKEYDLKLEFTSLADKAKFQDIINAYAKKDADDEQGLIYASWWQPLYHSNTELADYESVSNNTISLGNYYAQTFSLNEEVEEIVAGMKQVNPDVVVKTNQFWVNKAFFNYLGGKDHK
ncbi:MAG: hypothetical protein NAG76_20620 [Candidatus Pristimantibacillus lignocellulolyticus]|uniref:SLH domain-containing protein n=1 Tax=Candidatus Pristimantibacillus lignocellulolyticus TaxID=2994561 RepID=A0A9J6ZDQ2_9BACL|nr:MAG: hypothetical protein NAG76_20620 [Candidatus Pristimantibacillus lignocellulolyticus]